MEKLYFEKALTLFELDVAFELILLKFGIKAGILLYKVDNIQEFDDKLYVKSIPFWSYVSLQEIDESIIYNDYKTGIFLGYITPLVSLDEKYTYNCDAVLNLFVKYGNKEVIFSTQIIEFKDQNMGKINKFYNRIKEFGKLVDCEVSMRIDSYFNSTKICRKVYERDYEWMEEYRSEVSDIIWNTGFEITNEYLKDKIGEEMIEFITLLVRYFENITRFDERQQEISDKIIEKYDKMLVIAIDRKDIQLAREILYEYDMKVYGRDSRSLY